MNNTFSDDDALNRDILIFTKRLLAFLKLGSTIGQALIAVSQDTTIESKQLKQAAANIARDIRRDGGNTKSLADYFSEYPLFFNPFYVGLVRIGRETGCDQTLIFSELLSVYGFERQLDSVPKH